MQFGVAFASSVDNWKAAQKAESLGFKYAWFYDTQMLNPDVFICMTRAALETKKIKIGTGVLVPSNRIEPVTANALATLNKIAPGRIVFGVGTGFTARRTMGLGAIPLERLRAYVERVQALLAGETIEWDFEGKKRKIRFLNPEMGLINLDDEIEVHVSAMGPKSRQLVAELEAGWINFGGDEDRAIGELNEMVETWRDWGLHPDPYSTLFALGCVLEEGEPADSDRAIAQAGPYVNVFFHNLVETTDAGQMKGALPDELNDTLERYREIHAGYEPADARYLQNHRGHLMFVRPEERELLTADLIRSMTLTGTPDELRIRIRKLAMAGYSQLTIQIVEGHEDAVQDWHEVCVYT